MNAVVAERGQVTIPKPLRDRLGITPHTLVDFEENEGRLILTKVVERDAVSRVMGCLRLGRSTDAILRELRGDA
jgi:AbrB family looped-hinge helix DNA binding protein